MTALINEVDARTRLAGANQMELLLFHVGTDEVFGINVFKVREVMKFPPLTRMPDADERIEGMVNIRGNTIPVIGLRRVLRMSGAVPSGGAEAVGRGVLVITECNGSLQAFHVAAVDRIMRISWSEVKAPPALVRDGAKGSVTAVTIMDDGTPDGKMVLIVDVEKILADLAPRSDEEVYSGVAPDAGLQTKSILFVDDSMVARTQIRKTLDRLGIPHMEACTGQEAWNRLEQLAERAAADGKSVHDILHMVLSDIEMPDMDGFTLTKHIRTDHRFGAIPVILHSSLTGNCNSEKGKAVGATDYVTKFDPTILRETIVRHCKG
jgi:two-component system, chemotaxis family, chemotaxis protein CheV